MNPGRTLETEQLLRTTGTGKVDFSYPTGSGEWSVHER